MGVFKNKSPGGVFSSFKTTEHSERLRNTFEEVQAFKRQLLKAETGLKLYAKATEEALRVTEDSITAFPRAWRKMDTPDSPNAAGLPEDDVLKPAPTGKKLTQHPSNKFTLNLETALQEEVYFPIERWHKQYQHIKTRIGMVEASRIEYDAARKDLGSAKDAQLKHTRKTDGKVDATLASHEAQAEAMLNVKRQAYTEIEEEVHAELLALVADSQAALEYISRALHLHARALTEGADAVQERETTLPHVDRRSSGALSLGSPVGTPLGTPTGTPTGYGSPTGAAASFRSPNFDTTPEQVARQAASFRSVGTPLGDSTRMGKFDEGEHDLHVHRGAAGGVHPAGVQQPTGIKAVGNTATVIESGGAQPTGIHSGGLQSPGIQSTGAQPTGLQSGGIQSTGIQSGGVQSSGIPKTANTADVSGTGINQAPASGQPTGQTTGGGISSPIGGTTGGQPDTPSTSQLSSGTVDEKRVQNAHDHQTDQTTTRETSLGDDEQGSRNTTTEGYPDAPKHAIAPDNSAATNDPAGLQNTKNTQPEEEAASGSMLPEFVRKWVPGT